ncbi:MAG: hypothetical protein ACOCRK_08470 [bacterium]
MFNNKRVNQAKLVDLDIDGIPELIINYGYGNSFSEGMTIITYKDNYLKKVYSNTFDGVVNKYKMYKKGSEYEYNKISFFRISRGIKGIVFNDRTVVYQISYNENLYQEDPLFAYELGEGYYVDYSEITEMKKQLDNEYGKNLYQFLIDKKEKSIKYKVYYASNEQGELGIINEKEFNSKWDKYFEQRNEININIPEIVGKVNKKSISEFINSFK